MTWAWLDGKFLRERDAFLPATDPAFLHGRGLFEVARGYRGVAFRLADHVERMRASARRFDLRFRPPRDLDLVVAELSRRNRVPDAYVRITLSGGGHLLVQAKARPALPRAWYRDGAEVMVAPWRRDPAAPLVGHKTLNYLENVLTHDEAIRRGCADALYVSPRGRLLEGCVTNVFLVVRGRIVTPSLGERILPGVTRKVITEIARVRERAVRLKELWAADEAFLTNALIEVLPIVKKPGPITRRVMAAYAGLVDLAVRGAR